MSLFRDEWAISIFPTIKKVFEEVLVERPAKQEEATGTHYGACVYAHIKNKGEIRNVTCNLAWTNPTANTVLQKDITCETVERMALDLFVDVTATDGVAASAADGAAGAADEGEGAESRAKALLAQRSKAWSIPDRVPRGYEIPIAVRGGSNELKKGEFERLGLDVVVNATWFAMKWAVEEKNEDAQEKLLKLILDWPFDFFLFEGTAEDMDEKIFKKVVNLPASIERLRDFCGLEATNMMRIAAEVREILQKSKGRSTRGDPVVPTAKEIHTWMSKEGNINWGLHRVPNERTVERLLRNWDAMKGAKQMVLLDKAKQMFGRDHLWDIPTKISAIVGRAGGPDLPFVCEALLVEMMRLNKKDPWTVDGLTGSHGRPGEVDCILWRKGYIAQMLSDYPALLRGEGQKQQDQAAMARSLLGSPWQMHDKLQGPAKDPTWITTLPTEASRLFFKHMLDLQIGTYTPEIRGALLQMPTHKFSAEKFHETDRVKRRFFTDFQIAYDSITKKMPGAGDEAAGASAEGASGAAGAHEKKKEAAANKITRVQVFKSDAEKYVSSELEAALRGGGGQDRWVAGAGARMGAWNLGPSLGRVPLARLWGGGPSLARVPLARLWGNFGGVAAVRPRSSAELFGEFRCFPEFSFRGERVSITSIVVVVIHSSLAHIAFLPHMLSPEDIPARLHVHGDKDPLKWEWYETVEEGTNKTMYFRAKLDAKLQWTYSAVTYEKPPELAGRQKVGTYEKPPELADSQGPQTSLS